MQSQNPNMANVVPWPNWREEQARKKAQNRTYTPSSRVRLQSLREESAMTKTMLLVLGLILVSSAAWAGNPAGTHNPPGGKAARP
jgi:hypothetical protein